MPELELRREDLDADPIAQFDQWFEYAKESRVPLPEGMALATVGPDGQPESRVVLLKEFSQDGFVFFTNYESRKGLHIDHDPRVALTFWWAGLGRQVRIEGRAERTMTGVSDRYFASRPRGSQLSASVSPQSRPVESREELERAKAALTESLEGEDVPRPPYWGGYLVRATRIEFWQGRSDRLHDRFVYELKGREWSITRLAP